MYVIALRNNVTSSQRRRNYLTCRAFRRGTCLSEARVNDHVRRKTARVKKTETTWKSLVNVYGTERGNQALLDFSAVKRIKKIGASPVNVKMLTACPLYNGATYQHRKRYFFTPGTARRRKPFCTRPFPSPAIRETKRD